MTHDGMGTAVEQEEKKARKRGRKKAPSDGKLFPSITSCQTLCSLPHTEAQISAPSFTACGCGVLQHTISRRLNAAHLNFEFWF
jgi:hypothetical protein